MLGERTDGGAGWIDAAVAMSVPFDLSAGCALLERSRMGRLYSLYFLRSLRRKVESKRARLAEVLDMERVDAADTIREFDEQVTAPLHGFESAEAYYRSCSSAAFLEGIRVPTLLLHARDDPFLPPEAIPTDGIRDNPALTWALEPTGGHVGFVEGTPLAPRFWADEATAAFLAHALGRRSDAVPRGADPAP
jgi:predicted alpha/beta-fold hydrolase